MTNDQIGTCVKDICLMKDWYYLPVFDKQNIIIL